MIKINAVDHLNMNVSNLKETIKFYSDVFGFSTFEQGDYNDSTYAIIGRKGYLFLCIYEVKGFKASRNDISHIGFHIENFNEIEETLNKYSVKVRSRYEYSKSKSIYISDPSGHEIELTSNFGGGF